MKYLFAWIILLLFTSGMKAQVSQLPVELPQEIKKKYPFLGDKFYNVEYSDATNGAGMFVLTINKKNFQKYVQKKAHDTLNYHLRKSRAYKSDCRYNNWQLKCNPDYTDLIDHKFSESSPAFSLSNNRNFLQIDFKYDLEATEKRVDRYFKTYECKKDTYKKRVNLLKAEFSIDQKYVFVPSKSAIKINFQGNANVDIRYGGCSIFINPVYSSRKAYNQEFQFDFDIDFSTAGGVIYELVESLTMNTKQIKITDDDTYYYIYCIRQTSV